VIFFMGRKWCWILHVIFFHGCFMWFSFLSLLIVSSRSRRFKKCVDLSSYFGAFLDWWNFP
jgi:hypothetical protein